jgi:hypothetical protein
LPDAPQRRNSPPLAYRFADHPDKKQVEVRYRNEGRRGICILPEHWPNQGGKIDTNGDAVFLHVDGRRFALEAFSTGYCPRCATYVAPGQEIAGSLSYRDFGLPPELDGYPKRLEFAPVGFACRPSHER